MPFVKAQAQQAALKYGMYGPPGSGKTLTALMMAEGLAKLTGKRVAFVDTERGSDFYSLANAARVVHPAAFDFDAVYTRSLMDVLDEVRKIDLSKHGVLIIDSLTHIWEAAKLAYEGRMTKIGSIPMHAWSQLKKPYKDLMSHLLSSKLHVILCGRMGNDFKEDEDGELKLVGSKMKAEGETAYEPHIWLRMESVKQKKGEPIITAFAEKDRTSMLSGKTLKLWPSNLSAFDQLVKPILPLLGDTQAQIQTDDEISANDAEAQTQQENQKAASSTEMLKRFSALIDLAKTQDELKLVGKDIAAVKKQMLAPHTTELRTRYKAAEAKFNGTGVYYDPKTSQE